MKVTFSVGAAKKSEIIKTARRIDLCKSFSKLALQATGVENVRADESRHIVSFQCDELEIEGGHSSTNWETVFHLEKHEKTVVINVPSGYIISPVIPGYY